MSRKPNVIVITTDQQRYDSIRMNGSDFMKTPNLDRIGEEGVSFSKAYCPNPVCTPSRVSIMTGQHLSRHGAYNIGTYAQEYDSFMSSILRKDGYYTHHIGKAHWHPWWVESVETKEVDEEGSPFKDFAGFHTAELSVGHATYGVKGHYAHWMKEKGYNPEDFEFNQLFEEDDNNTGDWDIPTELHSGYWLVDRAIDFLQKHDKDQPFYLNLGFQDPHHPHILPSDYESRVDPETVPLPDIDIYKRVDLAEHIGHFHEGTIGKGSRFTGEFVVAGNGSTVWKDYFQDEEKMKLTRAYYYSMVQLIDDQLGKFLKEMDKLGLSNDTIVIFTTDHGEMLGDHCIGQKGPLIYEGVTHIPFLMRYPNGFESCHVQECVSLVDILPTVLDFVGIDDAVRRDGISLKTLLQEGEKPERNGVRIEYKEEPDCIRYKCWVTEKWKLGVYLGEEFGELYDLENDPNEHINLFNNSEYTQIKSELLLELLNDMERSEPVSVRPCRV